MVKPVSAPGGWGLRYASTPTRSENATSPYGILMDWISQMGGFWLVIIDPTPTPDGHAGQELSSKRATSTGGEDPNRPANPGTNPTRNQPAIRDGKETRSQRGGGDDRCAKPTRARTQHPTNQLRAPAGKGCRPNLGP